MDDNQLGRNIKHLRELHDETLEELGAVIHCAKSTVKGYENGSRKPDLQTLQLIAAHYNMPVDELLHADLTELEKPTLDLNSLSSMIDLMNVMIPLYCSEAAMKNDNFKRGYELSQRLLHGFSNAENFPGSIIYRIFEAFLNAAGESKEPEAIANVMWCIFIWWNQIFDIDQILSLQNKQLSKKLHIKDYMRLRDMESDEIKEKRKCFIADFESIINETLKALKSNVEWADLADYYLALRYVVGMVDTGLTTEMSTSVGMQMMLSFMAMGNDRAFRFCKICMSA